MAKNTKSRLSFLNSFQICRPKNPSSLVKTPSSVEFMFSPISSKSYDISFPTFLPPPPPPSTPNIYPSSKRNVTQSKISPFKCECCESGIRIEDKGKLKNSFSTDSGENTLQIGSSRIEKNKEETRQSRISISSQNSSHDHFKLKTTTEIHDTTPRFKHVDSRDCKGGVTTGLGEKPVSNRLVPCLNDGKVCKSFVVVKKSYDPYEDFKKSMLEMIMEKQMFEPEQLEQLLMNFISLNSRLHHRAIIEAFTEIWKNVLFESASV